MHRKAGDLIENQFAGEFDGAVGILNRSWGSCLPMAVPAGFMSELGSGFPESSAVIAPLRPSSEPRYTSLPDLSSRNASGVTCAPKCFVAFMPGSRYTGKLKSSAIHRPALRKQSSPFGNTPTNKKR